MSIKSEKLVKNIQEIQQFVSARSQQHNTFAAIAQALEKSVASLKEGKLTLQIVSQDPGSAKALYDLLRTRDLSAAYQVRVTPLTNVQRTQPEPTAALVLQTSTPPQRYPLSTTGKLAIGRHPECQILIPDPYVLVSGYHANIQPDVEADQQTYVSWQICDLSRNGTYINEQQVQGCQVLMEGDRITLGAPTPTETSPELLFEHQSIIGSSNERVDTLITECDVLCWIMNPHADLTAVEQQLLEQISTTQFTNLLVIAELSASPGQSDQFAKSHRSKVNTWLKTVSPLDVFWLPLHDLQSEASADQLDATAQQESDKFFKLLESLVKRKPEDILSKRLTMQVLTQLSLIEHVLDLNEKKVARETQRDEAKLKQPGQNQIKEKVDLILKQIQDDKGTFLKQVKDRLKQSKVDLLDDYLENSISCKIRRFVDQLKPHVVKHRGRKYIQLRFSTIEVVESKSAKRKPLKPETVAEKTIDANTALMNFCRSELSWWADEAWEALCLCPQNGLRGLLQRTYETLHSIPSVNLNRSLFQPEQSIDNRAVFEEAFAMPVSESRYQEASPVAYMLKKS